MTATYRFPFALALLAGLAACSEPFDLDMRGRIGSSFDTSDAARNAIANRPQPDDRGVISYPNYQVAIAQRGDTIATVAERLGLPAAELARYNGIKTDDALRKGEVVALPRRVAEPSPATGAATTGPIRPAADVDVTTLAGAAIDRAAPTPAQTAAPKVQTGTEPDRHKVARGETAFTIARLYNVSPRALAEWNGLDREFSIREGQFLLIPVVKETPPEAPAETAKAETPDPGAGSPTPEPPSASQPLPQETLPAAAATAAASADTAAAAAPKPAPKPVADIGQSQAAPSQGAMVMPVTGRIIREYAKGRNEGIDIAAVAGTPVKAAASGTVASITTSDQNILIVVIKHPRDLLTIYTHLDQLSINKGDAVSRGQSIGKVRAGSPSFVHFEVREEFESRDPMLYLK